MKRLSPAFALAVLASVGMSAPAPSQGNGFNAPTAQPSQGDRQGNTFADRVVRGIVGGRIGRRGIAKSRNGRPDTGVARIKRAARKRRNQIRAKRRAS